MSEIECITLNGNTKSIQKDSLILRPAAYAIIVQDGKLLLLKMRFTGKYHLPGGGIKIGERMEATLKREALEETGIEIDVVQFAHFEEVFFYYNPSDKAYHGLHFYYMCKPRALRLLADDKVDDGSAERPRWVEIRELLPDDFQYHGEVVLELCKQVVL
jgi:8-oxo-dGTP pyrophosphatase MutT (NUDIX family)